MKKTRKCKEKGCQGKIPTGKSLISWYCRELGYCRYCYRMNFPKRKSINLPVLRLGSERLLSWDERRDMEETGFNLEVWSKAFRRQMLDYFSARRRGELR